MNAKLGWALAVLAVVIGYFFYGWRGVALAGSGMVFWLLLQISRAMRVMRSASQAPIGTVPSAVMLNARLHAGLRLMDIIGLTRSLGEKQSDAPETWRWHDGAGDSVQVVMHHGRCTEWALLRSDGADARTADAAGSPPVAGA